MGHDLARIVLCLATGFSLSCGVAGVDVGLASGEPGGTGDAGSGGGGGTGGSGGTGGIGGTGGTEVWQRSLLAVSLDLDPTEPFLFEARYRVNGDRLGGTLVPLVADGSTRSGCGRARQPAPVHPDDPDGEAAIPFEGTISGAGLSITVAEAYLQACTNAFSNEDIYLLQLVLEGDAAALCGRAEALVVDPFAANLAGRFGSRALADGQDSADVGLILGCR